MDLIDTWGMTVENLGAFEGKTEVELPGTPYMAIRVRPLADD